MPAPNNVTITLQKLSICIANDDALPLSKRRELRSAIATFAKVAGRDPAQIIADPGTIRAVASQASWQLAGLAKGTLGQTRCRGSRKRWRMSGSPFIAAAAISS